MTLYHFWLGALGVALVVLMGVSLAASMLSSQISRKEEQGMAVAGGVTVAYLCGMVDGELVTLRGTSTLRSQCVAVAEAVDWLTAGQQVIVAGADMSALRSALRAALGERSGDNCILSSGDGAGILAG